MVGREVGQMRACTCVQLAKDRVAELMHRFFFVCRRANGQQGYVPATYVTDMEPAKVRQVVKRKVLEEVPVKVTRKEKVMRRTKKNQNRSMLPRRPLSCELATFVASG